MISIDGSKLRADLTNKKFTDFELIIKDSTETITLHLHKIFLSILSEYFTASFTYNNTGTTMVVDNASIMRDAILSCYGITNKNHGLPQWKYRLEIIKCRNYLRLEIEARELYDLVVPPEGFDLLLEVIEQMGVIGDRRIVRLIKSNLPPDHDLNQYTEDFRSELLKKDLLIVSSSGKSIRIWDAKIGDCIRVL